MAVGTDKASLDRRSADTTQVGMRLGDRVTGTSQLMMMLGPAPWTHAPDLTNLRL